MLGFNETNIRKASVKFDDGTRQKISLMHIEGWQTAQLQPIVTTRIRIIVERIFNEKDDPVYLYEMEIWGK